LRGFCLRQSSFLRTVLRWGALFASLPGNATETKIATAREKFGAKKTSLGKKDREKPWPKATSRSCFLEGQTRIF